MSNKRNLYEIAESVAGITLELMEDSIDWQLSDYPADGDSYNAIHITRIATILSENHLKTSTL